MAEETVGFVGLGAMGMGMATTLAFAGFRVRGYDINRDAVTRFVAAGGIAAESVADAANGATVFVIVVVNAAQAEDVLFGAGGAAAALPNGCVVLLCSTVMPAFAADVARRLGELGILMLDSPISGGAVRAAQGELSVMASGSDAAFKKAKGVLDAMAADVHNMGAEAGQGSTMKLVNQILAGVHIATAAEALAFGARAGIDPHKILEVIRTSAGASFMFQNRVPHILADDFTPLSAVDIWVKDLDLVLQTGKTNHMPTPITAIAYQLFVMASAAGYGRLDDSAVVKVFEQLAQFRVLGDE